MDQNSTNGSESDKRNWRERLGIGAKEMPKLSDEFREASAGPDAGSPPPGAQTVTTPAPMAPRTPRPAAPAPAAEPRPAAAAPPPRATPRTPDNAAQEALADKLRAQRVAAERLAEQRVQAARERAEGKPAQADPPPTGQRPGAGAPRMPPPPAPPKARAAVPPPAAGSRPKFSFADDSATPRDTRGTGDAAASRPSYTGGAGGAPLTPPRPALGGGQPPFLRPSATGGSTRPQPPYKPVDPSANYGAPPRLQPPPGRPGFGADAAASGYTAARSAPRRPPPALESFPRQADQREYPDSDFDDGRSPPRLGRPTRSRARDDDDEVFEDEGASRPRASARDYQAAYGEGEDAFAEDQRRSGGPWLLLLGLIAAGLVAFGGFWYYNSGMKDSAGSGTGAGSVPVVSAPEDPAKVAPEVPAAGAEQPAAQKKQIYDRIVGDQEVLGGGQIQSTEEIPVAPAAAQPVGDVPAASVVNPIPAPDAAVQGTGQGLPSVDEPPPLPLPPADQEGNLGGSSTERVAATAAEVEQEAGALPSLPVPEPPATAAAPGVEPLPPPPEPAASVAAVVPETAPAAQQASQAEQEVEAVEPPPPPPPPKKKPAEKKKPPEENLGAVPVVLVPPSKEFSPGTETASSEPVALPEVAAPQAEKKPRSIMDLFRGSGSDEAPAAQPKTRVAAVEPPQPSAPAQSAPATQPAAGSGFVVQLSSFRSAADARKEYARLSSLYPSVVGSLPEQIRETSVGGSTRYQLGLGPVRSRSDATRVCSALITAGESDCIVRGR